MTDTRAPAAPDTPPSPPAPPTPAPPTPPAGNPRARKRGLMLLGLVVLIAAIVWAVFHFLLAKPEQETDDAYVAGDVVAITARDPGQVTAIHADNTQVVKAGQPLIDLDAATADVGVASAEAELARALSFGTEHLSLYQLTIEPGTRFATEAAKGRLTIPDGDTAADLFEATRAMTAAAGLPAYETSNHARPGAESRHNLTYWRYGDYAGVGPGAHGRRYGLATQRRRKPENWLAAVARNGHGIEIEEPLVSHDRGSEALVMGLRLREGIDLPRIAALAGGTAPIDWPAVARLEVQGLIAHEADCLRVTEAGALLLDAILPLIVRDAPAG